MSELASALFSIADANEFRFARFYIVCEAVMLGTLKSPLIVCGVSDTSRGLSNVERHGIDIKAAEKKFSHFVPTNILCTVSIWNFIASYILL